MRKSFVFASILVTALFLVAPAAQAKSELRSFGFGVSVDPIGSASGRIEIPYNLSQSFRIAPVFSLINSSTTTKPDGGDEVTTSQSSMGFGLGAYSLMRTDGPYLMYVGGRVGALMTSNTSALEVTTSGMDIGVSAVVGSEYFFNPRFSLGAEIGLDVLLAGDREADKNDDKAESTSFTLKTAGAFNARFYF